MVKTCPSTENSNAFPRVILSYLLTSKCRYLFCHKMLPSISDLCFGAEISEMRHERGKQKASLILFFHSANCFFVLFFFSSFPIMTYNEVLTQ